MTVFFLLPTRSWDNSSHPYRHRARTATVQAHLLCITKPATCQALLLVNARPPVTKRQQISFIAHTVFAKDLLSLTQFPTAHSYPSRGGNSLPTPSIGIASEMSTTCFLSLRSFDALISVPHLSHHSLYKAHQLRTSCKRLATPPRRPLRELRIFYWASA